MVGIARWDAIGTWCEVLTCDDSDLTSAAELARDQVEALDQACSRFRDSELASLPPGRTIPISPLLTQILAAAMRTARASDGLVDPTVGGSVRAQGYDADFADVAARTRTVVGTAVPAPGWRHVHLDEERHTVRIPLGVELDLGASAKAWAADWIAETCLQELGAGTLVNLGGDIAVRGPIPDGGWQVEIDEGNPEPTAHPIISMTWPGGLATSSTVLRTWTTTNGPTHHIIDPRTGTAAPTPWRAVTVAARSCERANAASTAAVIIGESAPRWLTQRELPARLVHVSGLVVQTNGWPRQRWVA